MYRVSLSSYQPCSTGSNTASGQSLSSEPTGNAEYFKNPFPRLVMARPEPCGGNIGFVLISTWR